MPYSDVDGDRQDILRHSVAGRLPQQDLVLVVGRSPVNLIVLSKIVERARMRVVTETPEKAGRLIEQGEATVVILDGGADMTECDGVMGVILDQKLASAGDRPFVIMLTMRNVSPESFQTGGAIDALVAKPVTPERLQPLIESVRDRRSQV